MVLCVAMASVCYIKCFLTLRNQKRLIRGLTEGETRQKAINACSYKKSMYTMSYVFMAFNLCYLPFIVTSVSGGILGESAVIWGAESMSAVAIYTNSFVNPVILFWRMKEIRRAVAMTIYSHDNHCEQTSRGNRRMETHELSAFRCKKDTH